METILNSIGLFLTPVFARIAVYSIVFPFVIIYLVLNIEPSAFLTDERTLDAYRDIFFNALVLGEKSFFPNRNGGFLRALLAQDPEYKFFLGKSANSNNDTIQTYPPNPNKTQTNTRNRAYDEVPYAIVLFIIGIIVMCDREVRIAYSINVTPDTFVPSVWNQWNLSVRDAQVSQFSFQNQLFRSGWSIVLTAFKLEDTWFDPDWLSKTNNMQSLLNSFHRIRANEGNYVLFEPATNYMFHSGTMLSATGISVSRTEFTLEAYPFASSVIPAEAFKIYIFDAILMGRQLSTVSQSMVNPLIQAVPGVQINSYTSVQWLNYICHRMAGTLHNVSPELDPPINPVESVVETPSQTTPRRGQARNGARGIVKLIKDLKTSVEKEVSALRNDLAKAIRIGKRNASFKKDFKKRNPFVYST